MTVRTAAVSGEVTPRETECAKHQPQAGEVLNEREALAISLAERIALDPHTVTDDFFSELKQVFSENEIVENGVCLWHFQLGQQVQHHHAHGFGRRECIRLRHGLSSGVVGVSAVDDLDGGSVHELLLTESRGVLIDFWSPWCGPCRTLRPHLHKLAEERHADWRFVAVNTDVHPSAAEAFGVSALPTLVMFRNGEELSRLAGAVTLSSVVATLDELTAG